MFREQRGSKIVIGDMKSVIRKAIIGVMVLFAVYITWLMLGDCIPRELLKENVEISGKELQEQGEYPEHRGGGWDNYTDAFFINSIMTRYSDSPFKNAIANAYTKASVYGDVSSHFEALYNGQFDDGEIDFYSRYWAGSKTLYAFLLLLMPLSGIRVFLLVVTIALLLAACFCIYRTNGIISALVFAGLFELKIMLYSSMCLAFSPDILLTLIGFILVYRAYVKKDLKPLLFGFFIIGSFSAYWGYWAYPIITIGLPLIYMVTLDNRHALEYRLRDYLSISVCWAVGLASTILVKIVLAGLVMGIGDGADKLLLRMGNEYSYGYRFVVLRSFIADELKTSYILPVVIVGLVLCLAAVIFNRKFIKNVVPYVILALYPIAWAYLTSGHLGHYFDKTFMVISYYAIFSFAIECIRDKIRTKNRT